MAIHFKNKILIRDAIHHYINTLKVTLVRYNTLCIGKQDIIISIIPL